MLSPTFVAPFLIMLREGIEAALIVGIIASYLKQTGRRWAMPWVWVGIVLAVLMCAAVAALIVRGGHEYPQKQQELLEGVVALIAVVILTSMVFWMKKAGRSMRGELQRSIDRAMEKGRGWTWALVSMAFLAVAREGLESLFFLLAIVQQDPTRVALGGAGLGLLLAVALGFGLYYGSIRMNLQRFFRITGVFIIFVAAGLLAGALTKLHEAGVWNHLQTLAFDWTQVLPVYSLTGSVLAAVFGYNDHPTVGEVAAWLLYLVPVLLLYFRSDRSVRRAAAESA